MVARLTSEGRRGIVTNAIFDAWTPARAYPHTHGAVRVLSETASARLATPIEVKPHELQSRRGGYDPKARSWNFPNPWPGGSWRLGDIVEYQLAASLAVLDHASRNREYWLRTALGVNRRGLSPTRALRLRGACAAARPPLRQPPAGGAPHQRRRDPPARQDFEAGGRHFGAASHVVLMEQPASRFAQTVLERQNYPDLRGDLDGPPRQPYDVTAHTLPLLLGVHVERLANPFHADLERVLVPRVAPGQVVGKGPRFALGHGSAELVALGRLLAEGFEVEWAVEPFAERERSFPAGTLLVSSRARQRLEGLALELGLTAYAVAARPRALRLQTPRVGLYRSWVPSMDEGWTRLSSSGR